MRKSIFTLLIIFFCSNAFAQKLKYLEIPQLTEEDVKSTRSTTHKDVAAEVLYLSYHNRIDYSGEMYMDVVSRVKIYDKDKSNDYLNEEISLYIGGTAREKLKDFKAATYNFEDGKIKTTKVENDSKFKSTEDKNYSVTKFAFPEVKNGSVVEYSYRIETPYFYAIPKVTIQRDIPVKYLEYILDSPKQLGYTINYSGDLKPTHYEVVEKTMYGGPHNTYSYQYQNIAAFKNENFVGNINNYKTAIKPEINSSFIGNVYKSYTLTWEDVRANLLENDKFGVQLSKTNAVKKLVPDEVRSIVKPEDRAAAILKYVQNNYKWNERSDVLADDGVRNLINTKIGNAAEINFLLIMLLRDAGIDADPVVLPTVSKGRLNTDFPSLSQLNYVIAGVKIGKERFYYDATSKYSSKNTLPIRALNYFGVLMSDKKAEVVNIVYQDKSETILAINAKLNTDGTFSGSFSDSDSKLYAMMVREKYDENKEEYAKTYSETYKFPLKNLRSSAKDNGTFETTFDFTADNLIDAIGNKLVFNPLLFLFAKNHSFDQEDARNSPLEFFSAYNKTKKVTITIPEGYVFENVPTSKKFRTDDQNISYLYNVVQNGNKLTIETTTTVNSAIFPKEYYSAFKQIFDNITKLEAQVVTAVKK